MNWSWLDFVCGVIVGALALAGVLVLAGTYFSERQEGGPPKKKKGVTRKRKPRSSGLRESL